MNKRLSLALLSLFFFGASHLSANLPARSIGASIERSKLSTEIVKRLISYDGSDQRIDCQALSEQYPALLTPEDVKNMIITLGKKLGRTVAQFQGHPLLLSSVGYIPPKNYKKAAKQLFSIIVAKRLLQERDQEPLEIDCRHQPGAFGAHLKTAERVKIANFFALIFRRNITCILDSEQDGAASSSVAHSESVHPIIAPPQNQGGAKSNSAVAEPSQPTATRTLPAAEPEPAQIIPVVQHPPSAQDKPAFYQELMGLIVAGKKPNFTAFAKKWSTSRHLVSRHANAIAKTQGLHLELSRKRLDDDSLQDLDADLTTLIATGGSLNCSEFARTWRSNSGQQASDTTVQEHAHAIATTLKKSIKWAQPGHSKDSLKDLDADLTTLIAEGKELNCNEFARIWTSPSGQKVTEQTVMNHARAIAKTLGKPLLLYSDRLAAASQELDTELSTLITDGKELNAAEFAETWESNSGYKFNARTVLNHAHAIAKTLKKSLCLSRKRRNRNADSLTELDTELSTLITAGKELNSVEFAETWKSTSGDQFNDSTVLKHAHAIAKTLKKSLHLSRKRLSNDSSTELDTELSRLITDGEELNAAKFAETWKSHSGQQASKTTVLRRAQKIKDSLLKSSQKRLSTEGPAVSQPNGPHPATNVPNAPAAEPAQGLQLLLEAMHQLDQDDAPVVGMAPSATK